MRKYSWERTPIAFAVAPLATVPVLALVTAVMVIADGKPLMSALSGTMHTSFFFAFFGLPIAYAVELVVGAPLYRYAKNYFAVHPSYILALTTVLGAAVLPLVWSKFFHNTFDFAWDMAGIGAIIGLAAGSSFVVIAFPRIASSSNGSDLRATPTRATMPGGAHR